MPEYAQDLVDYLNEVGERSPTKILKDPELTRRALSAESPATLVAKVAEAIKDIDAHPAIASLSDYEKGRVFGVLGRNEEAERLFDRVLETSEDSELKGKVLMNKAYPYFHTDPEKALALSQRALEEGYKEARTNIAAAYRQMGEKEKAVACLLEGIENGEAMHIPALVNIFCEELSDPELNEMLQRVIILAIQSGISTEEIKNSFKKQNLKLFVKPEDKVLNLPALLNAQMEVAIKELEFKEALGAD